jgi:hypothetical protein
MEDFKILAIQKSFLCSLGEISLVYNLHIENNVVFVWFFFKSNAVSFRCVVDTFDVLSTKEQLVNESPREVFLGGPQTAPPIF